MFDREIDCVVSSPDGTRPLYTVRPPQLAAFLDARPAPQAAFLRAIGFTAAAQELAFLPNAAGLAGAALGLGEDRTPWAFGNLAFRLPAGSSWRLEPGDFEPAAATLGFCLGAYRFVDLKPPDRAPARLFADPSARRRSLAEAAAVWMVRDLINTPANLLGPAELAAVSVTMAHRYGGVATVTDGATLEAQYPTVAAVGRGSARPPCVATLRWSGSAAPATAPLIALCGKGVCFDTGGYDLKPSAGMLRMKKDMGGAATALGLARLIMEADLPVRLVVRLGCVENSVSGTAMRPLDVVRTRSGRTVEIGNTDAEGRLVLCDLLSDAAAESPDLILDFATLTGAARVALGPELPALFCNDDAWAAALIQSGNICHDPIWRLPLWSGYESWLASPIAEMNNVSSKPFAGAVTGALFLQRFVTPLAPWAHFDLYAWNDQALPGRPEGGEAQVMRGLFTALTEGFAGTAPNRNRLVTSS